MSFWLIVAAATFWNFGIAGGEKRFTIGIMTVGLGLWTVLQNFLSPKASLKMLAKSSRKNCS